MERITPTKDREPREGGVIGIEAGLILNGQRCEVDVRGELAGDGARTRVRAWQSSDKMDNTLLIVQDIGHMTKVARTVLPKVQSRFDGLGQRLRLARMRRRMSLAQMAEQTGISRDTLHRLERGDASISIAALLNVLSILGMGPDLDHVGADDLTGRTLQDMAMTRGRRRTKPGVRALPGMRRQDLIDFAHRDWPAIAELKAAHWLERKRRFGRDEAFRVADNLRRHVAAARPDWPDEAERVADVASHVAVGESLRRVRIISAR